MSYRLSMVPDWRRALAGAVERPKPGGVLAIVDFGDFRGLPDWLGEACIEVLARHDVTPCRELAQELRRLAASPRLAVRHHHAPAGVYQLAIVTRSKPISC
jgi:S-adenosylmethionine-diacylgycerolhomoserine-N-methlytransferase